MKHIIVLMMILMLQFERICTKEWFDICRRGERVLFAMAIGYTRPEFAV